MDTKTCSKCGACWIGGQLFWATGKAGKEEDLAGLVCNNYGDDQCINPMKGDTTGDTWVKRDEFAQKQQAEWEARNNDR